MEEESKAEQRPVERTAGTNWKKEAIDWIKALAFAGVLVVAIRWLLFSPYIVDGPSMLPNFHTGERVIVNKLIYDIREPKRGEIVVFHSPYQADYIKRVIALPGETVEVRGDTVLVDGEPLEEPYLKEAVDAAVAAGGAYNNKDHPPIEVPEGHVFVMGDNRPNSHDSRDIGPVPFEDVVGRADIVIWPIADVSIVNH